ncbi:CDP-diacylglycerol--glycerol-3-phosphate 3-phosphatidyltransferase [Luteibacter rhizovicinus DSM 16549]|uniref:CDP-diacylglycerol--glycerol-3-phosphate 3-phosphatidyltransferase n=1 Tax=Luteibacter rhizovicinus DSM 16549 TaxID=1440763 RepID=A0A0G9HLB6_9GAMM|nr:CDP-diacylglycerol--glycerol-3-phosphate 3-phosphatidyltransferase [Luteibacter rhizovicinus]APG04915.1 CDP-diacylglycerol--glycerol-3-phosphate 3-phosphatidyltransferase [Luteibacter rhizovicinus DSM 16549]KLD68482.1 CDP-diacylglycerol--glycerol-3-phosphate 3-phosphatidyltransferase [Luteibacter rhizovicinus DSM 16549]KLD76734.1 CDP-diacylglycerol--glycerol-3-phosphate 3-phosphatidyltransferase [Xanthomonas hyacinthi DSM 19077]
MRINLPTWLTLFRVLLLPVMVVVFYLPFRWSNLGAAAVFVIAGFTDWLDGYLARRMNLTSAFGAFLDPVADKLMVAVTLFLLVQSHPGGWQGVLLAVTASVIVGREISVSALREWMAQIGARSKVKVAFLGKLKTLAQMVALVVLLVQHDTESLASYNIGEALLVLAGILTIWSGLDYLRAAWPSLRGDSDDVKKSEKKSVQSG